MIIVDLVTVVVVVINEVKLNVEVINNHKIKQLSEMDKNLNNSSLKIKIIILVTVTVTVVVVVVVINELKLNVEVINNHKIK
jgi:hypothetical protein